MTPDRDVNSDRDERAASESTWRRFNGYGPDIAREADRLQAENTWFRNQIGDVRGMQSDGATPEEMDEALGRALSGEQARQAFDESRASIDETGAAK